MLWGCVTVAAVAVLLLLLLVVVLQLLTLLWVLLLLPVPELPGCCFFAVWVICCGEFWHKVM